MTPKTYGSVDEVRRAFFARDENKRIGKHAAIQALKDMGIRDEAATREVNGWSLKLYGV